jgi:hypothetical protein
MIYDEYRGKNTGPQCVIINQKERLWKNPGSNLYTLKSNLMNLTFRESRLRNLINKEIKQQKRYPDRNTALTNCIRPII